SILKVLCKYKIVQKILFKRTELNSVRFYVIKKIKSSIADSISKEELQPRMRLISNHDGD
ncbi:MAG: hypothetical protein ACLTLI_10535, partial [Clostridia bacterium]